MSMLKYQNCWMKKRKNIHPTFPSSSIAINITDAMQHDAELMLDCGYALTVLRQCSVRKERKRSMKGSLCCLHDGVLYTWCCGRDVYYRQKKKVVCLKYMMQQSSVILPKKAQIIAPPYRATQQFSYHPFKRLNHCLKALYSCEVTITDIQQLHLAPLLPA
eukprot:13030179-Ditylum_brightwellii.AAC.1